MACPKVNPSYPNTAVLGPATPLAVLVRRAEPGFDKARRFDLAYEFGGGRRRFREDSLIHGAYGLAPALANDAYLTIAPQDGSQPAGPFSPGFSPGFENPGQTRDAYLAALDAQFRADNGFCDPIDNGTVFTGTGAGGANPGSVPSLAALVTPDGLIITTPDGFSLDNGMGSVAEIQGADGSTIAMPDGTAFTDGLSLGVVIGATS